MALSIGEVAERTGLGTVLRASGMPVPEVRRYTALVRAGGGNERERLALLREHRDRMTTRMAALTRSLDLVDYKIGVYEDILDDGSEDGPAENGPPENGPPENGPPEDGPPENGPAENGRAC
jgi:hypothetical protein